MIKFKLDSVKLFSPKKMMFRVMLWLMVSCAVLLAIPSNVLAMLALDKFVPEHAHFVGLGLIVSIAYFLTQLLNLGLDESIRHLSDKRMIETIEAKVMIWGGTPTKFSVQLFAPGFLYKNLVDIDVVENSHAFPIELTESSFSVPNDTIEKLLDRKSVV